MQAKILIILILTLASVANAEVQLQSISGSKFHTIKITKSVLSNDLEKFQAVLEVIDANKMELHMNAVQLDITGGDPEVAREIGRIIRERKLNTFLSPKSYCISACIYLAISGVHRMIYGNVLLHRLTLFKEDLSEESIANSIRAHTQESNQFIADMGGSFLLAEAINFTPNWALRRLDEKELRNWGVFGSDHVYDEILFRRGAKEAGISADKFKRAYVHYFEICRKEEYSFKSFAVDCTIRHLKKRK